MRVTLVFLNFDCPVGLSHGLAVLSAELRRAGHAVTLVHVSEVLDIPFDPADVTKRIAASHPDVVGLSFGTNHAWAARILTERIHQELPEAFLVCGGIHATIQPKEVLSWPGVDAVALGEADDGRFVALLDDLDSGRPPWRRVGFWFKEKVNGRGECRIHENPMAPPVDLDQGRHTMDLTLFDHARIITAKRGYADAISGRGCPFRCTYCHNEPVRRTLRSLWGSFPTVRKRPIDELIQELGEYRDRYGKWIRIFSFTDDVFPGPNRWTGRFFDAYRSAFDLPLVFCAAPPQVTDELATRATLAGTYMVRIGVESGSERVRRDILGRPFSNQVLRNAVQTLQRHQVNALTFFMLAMPGETPGEVLETFRLAASLQPDAIQISVFWPYPGTQLHDRAVALGLFDPADQYRGNYLGDSPLQWSHGQDRLYRRIRRISSAAVNASLHPKASFGSLVQRALDMPDEEWNQGGLSDIRRQIDAHQRDLLASGEFVYVSPFPDRPDLLLLAGRKRTRPLLNLPEEYIDS